MQNAKTLLSLIGEEVLPLVETWLRSVIADEVQKALEADRMSAKPERYLSREEVSSLLGISTHTLWERTRSGKIKATYIGRRVTYAESEIKRFMTENGYDR